MEGKRRVDVFTAATRLRVFLWSLVGAFLGGLLGVFMMVQDDRGPEIVVITTSIGWLVSMILPLVLARGAGRAGSTLYAPSGRGTPHRREYSQAETLAIRGEYESAIAAFRAAISSDPRDGLPYLRIARIHRDHLANHSEAASWFRKALHESSMDRGQAMLTRKELVELYEVRMREPGKATPMLARLAEEAQGSPEGDWAATELARIKAMTGGEHGAR